jgi:uncharacterized protein (TIGR00251 family)
MTERTYRLHNGQSGAAITVSITTRASQNQISEILDDGTIKIRLTEPHSEGKANKALLDYLAQVLDIKASDLEIVAGSNGKDKLVVVSNLDATEVHAKIIGSLS